MTMPTNETRRQELAEFANAGGQPNQPTPHGHALVKPTQSLTPVGAQPVAVYRDEAKILQKLAALAAAAGGDWFYRFPVRRAEGGQDWIEGPSIKLANDIARIFGNCVIEVRELDVGDAFVFYARFSDLETGFSMERAYRQRKGQQTFRSKDIDRQLDIVYQIGQSKAIRNVIVNSLQIYADYAFDHARNSLVEKIGKDIDGWRARTVEGLERMPVELHRVERMIGRPSKEWLAPDIARIVAMMRAVADGMATIDETFPPDQTVIEKEKAPQTAPRTPDGAAPASSAAATVEGDKGTKGTAESSPAASKEPTLPKNFAQYFDLVRATCAAATDIDELKKWFQSDTQRKLRNTVGLIAEETKTCREIVEARVKELSSK